MFETVSLTKHVDIAQYKYSGYGIGFDRKGEFSFGNNRLDRNCIVFEPGMSSFVHANNKTKKNILVLDKDLVQGLDNTKMYAEKLHLINFTKNSYLLMVQKFINLKKKF